MNKFFLPLQKQKQNNMKTIEINLYKFDELPSEVQQNVLEKQWDINVEYDWWENTYYDAKQIDCKISGFDIDRGSYCDLTLNNEPLEVAKLILEEHGETCETYQIAKTFIEEFSPIFEKFDSLESKAWNEGINSEEEEELSDLSEKIDTYQTNFEEDLSQAYLTILRGEFEYLTSEEAIKETLISNDYDFTEDGELYS